jgi:hypothetical protein
MTAGHPNHLCHLLSLFYVNVGDLASDQGLSKEQVVEVVELVEKELLRHPTVRPVKRDIMISHPLTIRVKDEI